MLFEFILKDVVLFFVGKINWLENGKVINELFKIFLYWVFNLLYFFILGDIFFIVFWVINIFSIWFFCKFVLFVIFKVIRDDCLLVFFFEVIDFKYKVVIFIINMSIVIFVVIEVYIIFFKYFFWCFNFKFL